MQNLKLYNAVLDELAKRMAQDCAMAIADARRLIEGMGMNLNSDRLMEIITIADNLTDDPDLEEKVRTLELQNDQLRKALAQYANVMLPGGICPANDLLSIEKRKDETPKPCPICNVVPYCHHKDK
jgi:hypothetical protein